MEEKNSIKFSFSIILFYIAICVIGTVFTGCASTRVNTADRDVLAYQAKITRLEDTITSYQHAIGYTIEELGDIRERTVGTEGTIDEIISLFDEYQRRVDEVLRRYRALQEHLRGADSNSNISSDIYGN